MTDDLGTADWAEEVVRVDPGGNVYVRLSQRERSVLLQVSPRDALPHVLARTPMGDVSYNEVDRVSEREAADVARAYAVKLETGRTIIARDFPHLATGTAPPAEVVPVPATAPRADHLDTGSHRFAISASGHTVVRGAFSAEEISALRAEVEPAFDAVRNFIRAGHDLAYTFYDPDTYLATQCLYCWGEACLQLLNNSVIERISESVLGPHKLFHMSAHSALPAGQFSSERLEAWHRDIDVFDDSPSNVRYLWFFVYLDDCTDENGAIWILPGSQRIPNDRVPGKETGVERFPTRVQLVGQAGDLVVINPSALHSVGHNRTERPRRMLNVGVCHVDVRPLLDHWAVAGPAIQERANGRLRQMLGAEPEWPLATTWSVLPPGWQTGERRREDTADPALRVFPREQQGFQRSHRRPEEKS